MTGWLERPVRLICILPCREVHVTWSLDFTDSLWFHRLRHWEVDSHPPPDNIDMNSPYLGDIDFSCFIWLWWCLQVSAGKWIWGHNFVNDLHLFRMLELCVAFKTVCEHICAPRLAVLSLQMLRLKAGRISLSSPPLSFHVMCHFFHTGCVCGLI